MPLLALIADFRKVLLVAICAQSIVPLAAAIFSGGPVQVNSIFVLFERSSAEVKGFRT